MERYVIPAQATFESTIRLLLPDRHQESLTVYADGFRSYEPLDQDDAFTHEHVIHGDGEYGDGYAHVNTFINPINATYYNLFILHIIQVRQFKYYQIPIQLRKTYIILRKPNYNTTNLFNGVEILPVCNLTNFVS